MCYHSCRSLYSFNCLRVPHLNNQIFPPPDMLAWQWFDFSFPGCDSLTWSPGLWSCWVWGGHGITANNTWPTQFQGLDDHVALFFLLVYFPVVGTALFVTIQKCCWILPQTENAWKLLREDASSLWNWLMLLLIESRGICGAVYNLIRYKWDENREVNPRKLFIWNFSSKI